MANPLKKTMVYLGLADEESEMYEQADSIQNTDSFGDFKQQQHSHNAPVTPLRKPTAVPHHRAKGDMNEILTVNPAQYKDAQIIAESYREGIPVIINLSQMSESDARRLIDFASGLATGLYGKIERVTPKVFLLSPAHIAVSSEDDVSQQSEDAFFVGN